MNAYDFDNTIFRGDSTFRFYTYCLLRTPRMLMRLPSVAFDALFVLKRDKQLFKRRMFRFLLDIRDVDTMIARFWQKNKGRVKQFYMLQKRPDDVIASASPEFLLRPIASVLGVANLIASPVDKRTGEYSGGNCHGAEKVRRFREMFPNGEIDDFYSDSHSDDPMAAISRRAFMVKGDVIADWNAKI